MNTTATQSMQSILPSSVAPLNTSLEPTTETVDDEEYHMVLLAIYSTVLLTGTISFGLMMHIMKSSSTSVTSVAVLNLIFTHFIFLLTVPFRIYYYANHDWNLGLDWCRVVSVMIHTHMYMSFIFYVIILVTRLMMFYRKTRPVAQFHRIHALLVSAVVWIVVLVVVPCIIFFCYGQSGEEGSKANQDKRCFKFGKSMNSTAAKAFNYIISAVIIVVATVLTALQANVLKVLYKKHQRGCTSQQEFWAQLKSLFFALIMVVCFVPYHIFRMVYIRNVELESINEVFLSLTTLNCLDMLTFLGNKTCYMCFLWRAA